jgi:hypothetical protein
MELELELELLFFPNLKPSSRCLMYTSGTAESNSLTHLSHLKQPNPASSLFLTRPLTHPRNVVQLELTAIFCFYRTRQASTAHHAFPQIVEPDRFRARPGHLDKLRCLRRPLFLPTLGPPCRAARAF